MIRLRARNAICFVVFITCLLLLTAGMAEVPAFTVKAQKGELRNFLGKPRLELQQLFRDGRFPNVVVTNDGTIVTSWGESAVVVRRSEDGGKTWGVERTVAKPAISGEMVVDESSGDVLMFTEERHPPAPLTVFRSKDDGKTWQVQETTI
ncbi:MAG: glycoside hydrolase, partial [Pirellulales bacterium]|nr:glycoside hydrolase [Pirellulales bacterium]